MWSWYMFVSYPCLVPVRSAPLPLSVREGIAFTDRQGEIRVPKCSFSPETVTIQTLRHHKRYHAAMQCLAPITMSSFQSPVRQLGPFPRRRRQSFDMTFLRCEYGDCHPLPDRLQYPFVLQGTALRNGIGENNSIMCITKTGCLMCGESAQCNALFKNP